MRSHTRLVPLVFVLATIVSFVLARLPVGRTGAFVHDASRLAFCSLVLGWLVFFVVRAGRESLTHRRQQRGTPGPYSVPRRFGLGTLFGVTLAFALFLAAMQLLQAHGAVTLVATAFLALIGGMQMAFDRAPRQASMIAGGILVPTTVLTVWIADDADSLSWSAVAGFVPVLELAFSLACWSVAGGVLGYLAGILVGSVFLAAAALGRLLKKRPGSSPPTTVSANTRGGEVPDPSFT
jgi:hypothetical protein